LDTTSVGRWVANRQWSWQAMGGSK
jgi:hypothetical protein